MAFLGIHDAPPPGMEYRGLSELVSNVTLLRSPFTGEPTATVAFEVQADKWFLWQCRYANFRVLEGPAAAIALLLVACCFCVCSCFARCCCVKKQQVGAAEQL